MSETPRRNQHAYDVIESIEVSTGDDRYERAKTQTDRLLEQWRGRVTNADDPSAPVARTYPARADGQPNVTLRSNGKKHILAEVVEADGTAKYTYDGERIGAVAFTPDGALIGESPDDELALHNELALHIFACDRRESRGDPGQVVEPVVA